MSRIKLVLERILHIERLVVLVLSCVGLTASTLLIFAQVVNRYWLHFEIMWFSDLALYIYIFFMFLSTIIATWNEDNVAVGYLPEKLLKGKPRGLAIHRVCLDILSLIIVCAFLPTVYQFMLRALQYDKYAALVPWFNTSWLQVAFFPIFILIIMHLLLIGQRDVGNLIKIWRSKQE